jgi:NitT/TauT family transport system substrate-binding protein
MSPPSRLRRLAALTAGLTIAASGCSLDSASQSSGNVVNVVIGYQSKTINTVTAGTLLRAKGYWSAGWPTSPPATAPSTT